MNPNEIFFRKDKHGNIKISIDQLKEFNEGHLISESTINNEQFILRDDANFSTCVFRSEEPLKYAQSCCNGQKATLEGFYCSKLCLFNVQWFDCAQCKKYESRK